MIRKIGACILGMLFLAVAASAQNAHFVSGSAATDSHNNLIVSFKEAGLGGYDTVTISASAHYTALWGCINGGSHHPKASNKEDSSGDSVGSGVFDVGHNGTVKGSVTIPAPALSDSTLVCPSGQTLVLMSVDWSNVVVHDDTSGASLSIPGTF